MPLATRVTACRSCGGALSIPFCDLGFTPLANAYVAPEQAALPDPVVPLNAVVCESCYLVQLDHVVDAATIFADYAYFSSYSSSWLAHAAAFTQAAIQRYQLHAGSFVVEVASNDGYLLRNFVTAGIPCLGVEPAANVATAALAAGVPTEVAFFGRAVAARLVRERGHADLIIANNVLAHVPDINDFVAGLAELAGPHGTVSIEAPHLLALIAQTQFDTIYHEHYAYWSLHAMARLLETHGLLVHAVDVLPTHGTSLRVLASADAAAGQRHGAGDLPLVQAQEEAAGLDTPVPYCDFEFRVQAVLAGFQAWLERTRSAGRCVAAYGAAAKGNTFLNAACVEYPAIELVADRNPAKQGRLLPGSRIPVVSPQALLARQPDDVLILPWNLAPEIVGELRGVSAWGGRLTVAIPAIQELQ